MKKLLSILLLSIFVFLLYGCTGINGDSDDKNSPFNNVKLIDLGGFHTVFVSSTENVFSYGSNIFGQLGDGSSTQKNTPTNITSRFNFSTGETVAKIILGHQFSMIITSKGRVFTWGINGGGQLGNGTTSNRNTPLDITSRFGFSSGESAVGIASGANHSILVTSKGRIFTWGWNHYNQLGDGTDNNRSTPLEITSRFGFTSGETTSHIALGSRHSILITSKGRVFTWGWSLDGAGKTTIYKSTPIEITSRFGFTSGETTSHVALGERYSILVTSKGRVFTWGINTSGQLGDGTTIDKSTPIEITSRFGFTSGETTSHVAIGNDHSLLITSVGRVFAWGNNRFGQLGDGTKKDRNTPIEITSRFGFTSEENIDQVSLGGSHSMLVTSTGSVFIWGRNDTGQLGDETTIDKSTPIKIN